MRYEGVSASIVIPTFNRPELIKCSVASALAALPQGGEVVVTDDRSEQPIDEVLARFISPNLRVTVNRGEPGAAGNRNHGVSHARGKLIFFLDDDDLLRTGYPAAILKWVENGAKEYWGFSKVLTHTAPDHVPSLFPDGSKATSVSDLPSRKRLAGLGCGFWIQRKTFVSLGGLDEGLRVYEDTEFSIRLHASGYEPAYSPEPGVSILQHEGLRLTHSSGASIRAECFRTILDKHHDYLTAYPETQRHLVRRMLKMHAKNLDATAGIRSAMREGSFAVKLGNLAYFLGNMPLSWVNNLVRKA